MLPGAILSWGSTRPRFLAVFLGVALLALPTAAQEPGQTPRPTDVEPPPEIPEAELVRLDKELAWFKSVEDPGPFIYRGEQLMDARRIAAAEEELKAYDYVLAFARRQPVDRLAKYATPVEQIQDLYKPIRRDYLRELLHIEGKLALVSRMQPTPGLKSLSGIDQLYEIWVFAKGTNKLICLVVSELPEGIQPGEEQTAWVAFDAYYFKLFHYESRRPKDPNDPDKHQWESAPLFLGRTFRVVAGPQTPAPYSSGMLAGVAGGIGALFLAGIGLVLYFRRGDRQIERTARQSIEAQVKFDNEGPAEPGPTNRIADQL